MSNIYTFFWLTDPDHKHGKFYEGGQEYKLRLVNLPTIIESHKTTDKKAFFKSGDIHQMMLVEDPVDGFQDADVDPVQRRRWRVEVDPKKWEIDSGITPPTHKIKQRKWRKAPEFSVRFSRAANG